MVAPVAAVESALGQGEASPDKGDIGAKWLQPVPVQDHQTVAGPDQFFAGLPDVDGRLQPGFGALQPDTGAVRRPDLDDR